MHRKFAIGMVAVLSAALSFGILAQGKGSKGKEGEASKEAMKIEDLVTKGENQKAVELAQKFIEAGEVTEGLYLNLGAAYFNLKNFEAAIGAFEKAVELNPFGTKALLYEATCYHELGQDEKVMEAYQRAIDIDPADNELRYNIAQIHEKNGKLEEALTQYRAIFQANPDFKDVAFAAGILLFNQGKYADAEPLLDKAVALSPSDEQVLLAVGQNYLKGEKYDAALDSLNKYLQVSKNEMLRPAVLDQVAVIHEKKKDYAGALGLYDQILVLRPASDKALLGKGNALVNLKRYDEALPVLRKYMEISKNEAKKKAVADLIKQVEAARKR
ncbi:MAG: tetratricopeptide repeat protein [Acidobacteriota bacterium]